ncbi:unnamed protein product [Alternaria alternata]
MSLDDIRSLQWPQDAPTLHLDNLQCLDGMHRIEAARRFLNENDKWWIVRLFSYDTSNPVLIRIVEAYSNEQKPSDGEIFRKIRLYHRENDQEAEKKWWSRLEKSKPKDLRQLFRRPSLTASFDALIDMPGLWAKLQLGALHRLLVLKCDEEMTLYLDHVAKAWKRILSYGDTMLPFSAIDAVTVQSLELLSPKYSMIDKGLRAHIGSPTTTSVLAQDVMEIDIPPESPNLDAQHTELQSRYETLQQEHNSILAQQEILVSKCGAQHERINHLENENAEMNRLLEKHTSEQQELNDAYCRAMEEQESGQKVKEQLRDLAYQCKAQSQKNMKLNSTCTKLRQELKTALKAGASDIPLESIEQVEPPLLIEATTKVDMEFSDEEPNSDDPTPHTWTAESHDRNQ